MPHSNKTHNFVLKMVVGAMGMVIGATFFIFDVYGSAFIFVFAAWSFAEGACACYRHLLAGVGEIHQKKADD